MEKSIQFRSLGKEIMLPISQICEKSGSMNEDNNFITPSSWPIDGSLWIVGSSCKKDNNQDKYSSEEIWQD